MGFTVGKDGLLFSFWLGGAWFESIIECFFEFRLPPFWGEKNEFYCCILVAFENIFFMCGEAAISGVRPSAPVVNNESYWSNPCTFLYLDPLELFSIITIPNSSSFWFYRWLTWFWTNMDSFCLPCPPLAFYGLVILALLFWLLLLISFSRDYIFSRSWADMSGAPWEL